MIENIFDGINWFLNITIIEKLIIPVLLAWFITGIISKRVSVQIEKLKHNNAKDLQIESFYRERGGEKLVEMLEEWANIFMNIEEVSKDDDFISKYNKLIHKTFVFGSSKTIKLLTLYQQYNYNTPENHIEVKGDFGISEYQAYVMVYLGLIAASVKKDFTNQDIDCMDLLKIKFTDYYENEKLLDVVHNKIMENFK